MKQLKMTIVDCLFCISFSPPLWKCKYLYNKLNTCVLGNLSIRGLDHVTSRSEYLRSLTYVYIYTVGKIPSKTSGHSSIVRILVIFHTFLRIKVRTFSKVSLALFPLIIYVQFRVTFVEYFRYVLTCDCDKLAFLNTVSNPFRTLQKGYR